MSPAEFPIPSNATWTCAVYRVDPAIPVPEVQKNSFVSRLRCFLGLATPTPHPELEVIPGELLREWPLAEPKAPGWHPEVRGWRLGGLESRAQIEIDEPIADYQLGVFPASNHMILDGRLVANRPLGTRSLPRIALLSSNGWHTCEPFTDSGSEIYVRFDGFPLRIGDHIVVIREHDGALGKGQ